MGKYAHSKSEEQEMSNAKSEGKLKSLNNLRSESNELARKLERRRNRGEGSSADWGACDPNSIASLISAATADGTIISFGYTRDGGAYMVGLFNDGERATEYCRATEDVNVFVQLLAADLGG